MLLALIFAGNLALFLPFVVVIGRASEEDRKMRARFAMLQTGGAGGLSSSAQTILLRNAEENSNGALKRTITRLANVLQLELLLLQADSRQTPQVVLGLGAAAAFGASTVTLLCIHSLLLALPLGVVAGAVPLLLLRLRAGRRMTAMNKALPGVLDMVSRALRAGHSLPAAIGIVAEEAAEPARSAFGEVFQKQKFGLPIRDALLELVRCFPSEDLKVFVTAILVQRDTGGNLVQILERTSTVIRERLKLQADVRVHTAQGRMTGWILCSLPVLMLIMLTFGNPDYLKVLTDDALGRKLLYGGGVLLCVGGFLINRIVKQIEV